MRKALLCLSLPLALAACGAEPVWAPDEAVARARYVSNEPTSLTLYTVVSKRNGTGGHSALMINASQRVLFDPAGSFKVGSVPERNDLLYGITERMRKLYIDYHARDTYDVLAQTILVSPAVAEQALREAQSYGAVNKAFCGNSVSDILKELPGFENTPRTFSPVRISEAFAAHPGVMTHLYHDGDPDIQTGIVMIDGENAEP
ncbi:hypothetical protein LX70_03048 [Defluviimonas denitrificans]|jgi:hypothetical protein|uniref:Lipoprotein n=1 Tax=Albidovulum denitrificans TaxID=404881 RepID=A0A2S8S4K0_9RHOB|nr:hypothetical protein [Defluviimonas denitrificans]PQV55727.1 hypothetical protein LX70_03048 [Defluviimonas denitrificans]